MTTPTEKLAADALPDGITARLERSIAWLERGELLPGSSACIGLADIKALHAALLRSQQPGQESEPTRPANSQEWRGMSGDIAFQLIERHADGWADIKMMMEEWRDAQVQQPGQDEREAFVGWLSTTYPTVYDANDAERFWRHEHVSALAWQAARLSAPQAAGQWLPIETAPKDVNVLLCNKSGVSEGGWLTDIDHGAEWEGQIGMAGWWRADGSDWPNTHWMHKPLPPTPAGEGG